MKATLCYHWPGLYSCHKSFLFVCTGLLLYNGKDVVMSDVKDNSAFQVGGCRHSELTLFQFSRGSWSFQCLRSCSTYPNCPLSASKRHQVGTGSNLNGGVQCNLKLYLTCHTVMLHLLQYQCLQFFLKWNTSTVSITELVSSPKCNKNEIKHCVMYFLHSKKCNKNKHQGFSVLIYNCLVFYESFQSKHSFFL